MGGEGGRDDRGGRGQRTHQNQSYEDGYARGTHPPLHVTIDEFCQLQSPASIFARRPRSHVALLLSPHFFPPWPRPWFGRRLIRQRILRELPPTPALRWPATFV